MGNKLRGYLRDRKGEITVFDASNASSTSGTSINAAGDVLGYFSDASQNGQLRGFIRAPGGNFTVFNLPAPNVGNTFGINNAGTMMGYFSDASQGGKTRSFVRDSNGEIRIFDAIDASDNISAPSSALPGR